ncbi:hypothetical protein HO173_007654 [Letharia columbiana]|uniref:Uncharacterized protein n=1 Tax=Letharia columbiana TaxID=112416 RepID=A0A8H6FT69_9LECA|nr:uncharacterized protein HO173_007654 [Letharia columbiana]KAF6234234.1 hypothetical protein HO173_007654 [Letharia columbiana]
MPLITESYDSLPYVDRAPNDTETAAAHELIASSLSPDAESVMHPLMLDAPATSFSPLIQSELDRVAANEPLKAIDLRRYEANTTSLTPDASALKAAYVNSSYLTLRLQALELLEQFGKNAWLVANDQLESLLKEVEKELVETREATTEVNRERKRAQEGRRGELEGGERVWRAGVGGLVEVQVATVDVERRWRERLRGAG